MRVFISYRREDTSGQAGRLYDALADKLGAENVFMDVDTIDIGVEFKHAIEAAVSSCDVLFVMIGPRWLTAADSRGERRLSRTDDYVRLEVETALGRNIRVVPALVAGAAMPVSDDLPGTLAPLTLRNAVEMADGPRWQYDVSRLMNLLERIRAGESQAEAAPPIGTMAALASDLPATAAMQGSASDAEDRARRRTAQGERRSARESPPRHPRISRRASRVTPERSRHRRRTGGGGGHWEGGSSGDRRPGGLSDAPQWLLALAGLGVVALLALALFGAYELGNDRSGSSASTQPAAPGTVANSPTTAGAGTNSTDVPANADADQSKLWLAIPKPIRRGSCKFADTEHAGGVATINCDYHDPKHGRTLVHLDRFVDFAHLQVIYKLHGPGSVAAHGGTPDPQAEERDGRLQPDTLARGRPVEPRGRRRRDGARQRSLFVLPGRRSVRPRREDEADRCQWLDLLRDRVDRHSLPTCS